MSCLFLYIIIYTKQEQDRKILEALAEQEMEEDRLQTERKETARADAAWMKQVLYTWKFLCACNLLNSRIYGEYIVLMKNSLFN